MVPIKKALLDVSQFFEWPAATGIQRVLLNLTKYWNQGEIVGYWGYYENGSFFVIETDEFCSIIEYFFTKDSCAGCSADESKKAKAMLLANTVYRVSVDDIPNEFNAYMLPEVTFNDSSLDIFENLLDRMPVCAIYYDSLHQTSSQLFPLSTALWTSRYFRVLYHCKHLMFISESVRNDFLKVFRYDDTCGHSAVIPLGADGIKSQIMENQETANQFICLSSLHIKKNYKVVLETFELRWSRGNQDVLVILGAEGDIDLPTLEKIRLYSNLGRVKWLNAASDAVVAAELSISKALIFVSEHEGFGLPPLEALRHKIPVIVYSRVPSICNLPELGQIRLDRIDIDSLDRALSVFDDSAKAASLKSEIDRLNLPTWNDFTSQVQKFVSNMIVS